MNNIKFAFHPGEFIKDEIDSRGWTQKQFANIINKSLTEVNELINGKRNITSNWAIIIAAAFDVEPETFLNMQSRYDCYKEQQSLSKSKIQDIRNNVKDLKIPA